MPHKCNQGLNAGNSEEIIYELQMEADKQP